MESPHSYICKTHTTIASSSSSISTLGGSIFLLLVFPYKWLENEGTNMPQKFLAPRKKVILFSIASMVVSNYSLDQLPLGFLTSTLFVFVELCIVFYIGCRGTFNLFGFCLSNTPLCFL
jgi:hypothetical protein